MGKFVCGLVLGLLLLPAASAWAGDKTPQGGGFTGPQAGAGQGGGFTGASQPQSTVAQALKMSDDQYVVLVGKIERHLKGDKYLFSDATGSITIDIDDDDWGGLTVGPSDTVEIYGEIDTSFTGPTKVDVDRIAKR